jgi:hypothetical protein
MALCTPIVVDSAEFCDNLEDQAGGLKDIVTIWPLLSEIATHPTAFKTAAAGEVTQMMGDVRAASAIVMVPTKFPIKLPAIMEENSLSIKDMGKGGWMNEATIRIQNTEHNRGVIKNLKGARFYAAVGEFDGDQILLGQSDGISTQFLARIKPESVNVEFGKAFGDDKFIDFVLEAKPYKAVTYPFAIAYE